MASIYFVYILMLNDPKNKRTNKKKFDCKTCFFYKHKVAT